MTAQQLISILADLIAKHGDGPVHIADWNERYRPSVEATRCVYWDGKFEIDSP